MTVRNALRHTLRALTPGAGLTAHTSRLPPLTPSQSLRSEPSEGPNGAGASDKDTDLPVDSLELGLNGRLVVRDEGGRVVHIDIYPVNHQSSRVRITVTRDICLLYARNLLNAGIRI